MQILLNAGRNSHKLQLALDDFSGVQEVSLLVRQQRLLKLIPKEEKKRKP